MTEQFNQSPIRHHLRDDFAPLLDDFDLEAFDRQESTIYAIRPDTRLAYVNAGWMRFARDNDAPDWLTDPEKFLDTPLLDSLAGPICRFYETIFELVLRTGDSYQQQYECSTPDAYRMFHVDIRPLPSDDTPAGLLLINSRSLDDHRTSNRTPVVSPELDDYLTDADLLISCSNCRRFRRQTDPDHWDWIPSYLTDPPAPISHSICAVCLDYFYPIDHREQSDHDRS